MSIRSASVAGDTLVAQFDWQPAPDLLDAIDNGIPLNFDVTLRAQTRGWFGWHTDVARQDRHLQLRYFPLSRYYQVRDLDLDRSRNFPARASALAALEDIRMPLTDWNAHSAERYRLDIAMKRSTLPGILRLSSLVRPEWWVAAEGFVWQPRAD